MPSSDPQLSDVAKIRMSHEYTDSALYERLSRTVPADSPFAGILKQLSATEHKHYEFWKKYAPEEEAKVDRLKLYWILFLRRVLGLTFASRFLDRHESTVVKEYRSLAGMIPEADKSSFEEMVADEQSHENEFAHKIETSAIRYISFVVLGLADALVEITGIHAGSLGIYQLTRIAGYAGIVAGAAASLAMASAAFAQAKQGFQGSARLSATYTGVSYFITAIILAAPYFIFEAQIYALTTSLVLAVIIITLITYYSTVISTKPFLRDYVELLAIMFGVTIALYFFGYVIRVATGISI
ncbi:MAG: rubrerythrin family protein [Thaumarchaeota archaeon]|nr:rubrerythrin family protein [Nitrososphaerota archaeon]